MTKFKGHSHHVHIPRGSGTLKTSQDSHILTETALSSQPTLASATCDPS